MHWIVKQLRFYRNRALEEYSQRIERIWSETKVVVPGFNEALCHYDLPVTRTLGPRSERSDHFTYSITTAAARLYLRSYLANGSTGKFPFLRLPAELRNHIYELTFSFADGPGLSVNKSGGLSMLVQHPGDDSYAKDWWPGNRGRYDVRQLPPLPEILALLLVCKQVFGEALPYFYQLNPLHVTSLENLTALAQRMPPSRLEHLNHLSIELDAHYRYANDVESYRRFPQTVKALGAIKDLKTLEIETNDKMWLSMRPANRQALGRKTLFKKFAQIPGMKKLAELAVSAGSFNLRGEAPELRKYLDSEMEMIKKARDKQDGNQDADSGKGKKRKATAEDTDAPSGGKKRTRRMKQAVSSPQEGDAA